MIRALSPYYITTNLAYTTPTYTVCEEYTLNIQVWDGLITQYTGSGVNTYQVTFKNTQGSNTINSININAMIQDYIEFRQIFPNPSMTTQTLNGYNQRWVRTFNTYDGGTTEYNVTTDFMTLGYSYGNEGKNYDDVTDGLLLKAQDYKVNRKGFFALPFEASATSSINVSAVSSPSSELNKSFVVPSTTNSNAKVQYLWVDLNDTNEDSFVTLQIGSAPSVILDIVNECKYTPLDVMFQNKDGAVQIFTFFKKQEESMSITDNHFETNRGQASLGFHQFVRHNVQARTTLVAETGFIDEDNTEVVKQLLLSERVWSYTDGVPSPLNIVDKSFKYKTRQNDRLISYTIKFEKSYNEINNI